MNFKNRFFNRFYFIIACFWLVLITIIDSKAQFCVGDVSVISIPRSIGCSYGSGSNAQWDGASGGTISDPGGSATSFTVTWTTAGTFRLKRTFPSGCATTVIYSSYYTISSKPTTPLASQVTQQPGSCGQVILNYTGGSTSAFWQTSQYGTSESNLKTMTVTTTGTYYLRIKSGDCWSDARSITVSSIPSSPVGGNLSGSTSVIGYFSGNLNLSGYSGNIKEYWYSENGGPQVLIPNTTSSINISISNNTDVPITRQYWAVVQLNNCEANSSFSTITVNPIPTPNASINTAYQVRDYTCLNYPPSGTYPEGATYYWKVVNGSVLQSNNTLGSASAKIDWGSSKTGTLTFCFYGYATWSTTTKTEVPICTYNYSNCYNTQVTQNNPLPGSAEYEWWWQTEENGTSLSLGSGPSIIKTSPGPLYLRSRLKYSPNTWGNYSQFLGNILVYTPPSTPITGVNASGFYNFPVTLSVGMVESATSYKWYSTDSPTGQFTETTNNSFTVNNLLGSKTYYVSALSGSCESASRFPVIATLIKPQIVLQNGGIPNILPGRPVVLAVDQQFDSYSWKDNEGVIVSTDPTYSADKPGDYTVTVTKTGLIGSGTSTPFKVYEGPFGQNINFIVTNTILTSGINNRKVVYGLDPEKNNQSISYFDDLGRPIQTVVTQGSPNQKDIVQPIVYDQFGREAVKYLPYVSGNDGWYKVDFKSKDHVDYTNASLSPQYNFYQNTPKVAIDPNPFAVTIFEASPLNRVIKQGAPGNAWQPDGTNTYASIDHTIKRDYQFNGPNEVLLWTYTYPTATYPLGLVNAGTAASPTYYAANQLYKNKTKDEQGNQVIEYVDKQGRTVLKRVQTVSGDPSTTDSNKDTNWASTYYIYDDFGNLVTVIPPEATKLITQTSPASEYFDKSDSVKNEFLKRWAFRYTYDGRRRMAIKQVPGAGPVYMVYDKRDRLVLTQDSVQRAANPKLWLFTKYDQLNRPILTGVKDTATLLTQAQMQAVVDGFYNQAGTQYYETFVGNVANHVHGYSNKSYPLVNVGNTLNRDKYLTVTYYDNYNFKSLLANQADFDFKTTELTGQETTYFNRVVGQVTGTLVRVLDEQLAGGVTWLPTVSYYDNRYRPIQVVTENYKGGMDRTTSVYDFVGKVLRTKTTHYALTWKDLVGMEHSGNRLLRTAASGGWGTSGIASADMLPQGQDGWFEFRPASTTKSLMIGFSPNNADANWTSIKYAYYLVNTGQLQVRENGGSTNLLPAGKTYAAGDLLRIERKQGMINFYKNGVLQLQRPAVNDALLIDASFNTSATQVNNVRSSFGSFNAKSTTRYFTYDHAGRLLETWHRVNNNDSILIAKNEYNELGELVTKKLHSTVASATNARQAVDYRYNIRGWLQRINHADVNNTTDGGPRDFFGMNLLYNEEETAIGNAGAFNGNISAMKWSENLGFDTQKQRAYAYTYDPLNRLKAATMKVDSSGWRTPYGSAYNTSYGYDLNGNIQSLTRKADLGVNMDILTYDYGTATSNQLLKVTDAGDKTKGFIDGVNTGNDYAYDGNGNLTHDRNKGIGTSLTDATNKIFYNYLNLPEKVQKSTTKNIVYVYDATGRKLHQFTCDNSSGTTVKKRTDYQGEYIYENDTLRFISTEEGRIVPEGSEYVYQYHLKDHLGNVRTTFTTKVEEETQTATMETSNETTEQSQFLYYDEAVKINAELFDHTNNGTTHYATRLNGTQNERYGLAKSLSVMPGDTINIEVYAKYLDTNEQNWTTALQDFMAAIANGTAPAGTFVDGGATGSIGNQVFPYIGVLQRSNDNETGPKGYLNYILFDREFNYITGGFKRLSTSAQENGTDVPHQRLYFDDIIVKQPGYMYIYLSNENETPVEVFFDDLTITHKKSPVIQSDDYYPFGLAFNSYSRENSTPNDYKYNGKEEQVELGLGWLDYGMRMYDPSIARWMAIDPASELMRRWSPYNYAFDNPLMFTDPDGSIPWPVKEKWNGLKRWVASWFGPRSCEGCSKNHKGLDINFGSGSDDHGAPVVATHDGKVVEVENKLSGSGRMITVRSPDGKFQTKYFHLSAIDVKVGDEVKEGAEIGKIGGSGNGSESGYATHLHYAIQKLNEGTGEFEWYDPTEGKGNEEGNIVDPQKWITGKSSENSGSGSSTKYTNSAPGWAKSNKFLAHIYFIFTGKDSGLPDQLQPGYQETNGFKANANRPDLVPDPEKRPGLY